MAKYRGQSWIPITEALPDFDECVLVYDSFDDTKYIAKLEFDTIHYWVQDCGESLPIYGDDAQITDWMPLPKKKKPNKK